ncbi:MAG: hypothetical protein WC028_05590 [Candidatus Obscuribacterales bacterium]
MTAKNRPVSKFLALSLLCTTGVVSVFIVLSAAPTLAAQPAAKDEGEAFLGENGDMFMEEVTDPKTKPKPKPTIPIDLSRVGVSVDPHGNIVPIKDSADDPWAGSGVKPFVNQIENTFQPLPFYGFAGPTPYGYGVPGYNMPGYVNPNLNYRALGNPGYGYGYPGYGYPQYGNPAYGYGYPGFGNSYGNPYYRPGISINFGGGRGGISLGGPNYYNGFNNGYNNGYYGGGFGGGYTPWNTFNSFAGGGNPYYGYGNSGYGNAGYGYPYGSAYSPYGYPAVGAPLATFNIGKFQGAIGSSGPGIYPNAANSVFFPSTTNYSQSSMWRAFNLAF